MLEVTCTTEQKVHVKLTPKTTTGRPAKLDGPAQFSVVDGSGTVEPDADGLGAFLISADEPGDTTYLVDGDADLGSGKVDVQDTILLHVSGAFAANLGLTADSPVDK